MGKAAEVQAVFADGPDAGRLQYEAPTLVFRGRLRRAWGGEGLAGVQALAGDLVLADGSRFTLGERAAASWAEAIIHPKGRAQKIGVKPGMRADAQGVGDTALAGELVAAGAVLAAGEAGLDLLFHTADSAGDLAAIAGLVPRLADRGALWVVSRKGKAATLRDVEVMAAAKAQGLVDNKVMAFSDTHTALRFVRRRAP
jgi:hypothetical protein